MKKLLIALPMIALLAACGTTDRHAKIAEDVREREYRDRQAVLDKAPDWMIKLPESKSAVYAADTAKARDYSMARQIAEQNARNTICMTAGGTSSTRMKTYSTESVTRSESISRSSCKEVDLTGAYVEKHKIINTRGGGYQAYVLLVLPTGDANVLKNQRHQQNLQEMATKRLKEVDSELN
jgi:hypothetical protein